MHSTIAARVAARFARTIQVDKTRLRGVAKELQQAIVVEARRQEGPLKRNVALEGPYEIRAVDGKTLKIYVRLVAVETKGGLYVSHGGLTSSPDGIPLVIIFINGSIPAEQFYRARNTLSIADQIYHVLLHEVTHAADTYSKGVGEGPSGLTYEEAQQNPKLYYNHPTEFRAYLAGLVDDIEVHIKHYAMLVSKFGPSKGLDYLLKTSETWRDVSPYWNESNKRLAIKTVAKLVSDWEATQVK
jgi:hypothetical protein